MARFSWPAVRTAVVIVAALTGVAGCGAEPDASEVGPSASSVAPEAASPTSAAPVAPASAEAVPAVWDWEAVDVVTGEAVEGGSFAGKDVILWFWAPWCPTCIADAPGVALAEARLPEGVLLLGVPGQADAETSRAFVAERGVGDFQHVYDPNGGLWTHYEVFAQPQIIAVNDDGTSELVFAKLDEEGLVAVAEELAGR